MTRIVAVDIPIRIAKLMNPEQHYEDFEYNLLINNISEAEKIANQMLLFILQDHEEYRFDKYKDPNDPEKQAIDAKNEEILAQALDTLNILRDAVPMHLELNAKRESDWRGLRAITVTIAKKEENYSDLPQYIGDQIEGTWVHMLKNNVGNEKDDLLYTKVVTTISINGEICASDFVQGNWFDYQKNAVGIAFQGVASHVFNEDMFSYIDFFGEREAVADKDERTARVEAWINPQLCTPTAIVVHPESDEEVIEEVQGIAEVLGLEVFIDTKLAGAERHRIDLETKSDLYDVVKNMLLLISPSHIVEYSDMLCAFLTTQESAAAYNDLIKYFETLSDYMITETLGQLVYLFPEEYQNYYFFWNPIRKSKQKDSFAMMLNKLATDAQLHASKAPMSRLLGYLGVQAHGDHGWAMVVDTNKLSSAFEATTQFFAENKPVEIDEDGTSWFSYETSNDFVKAVSPTLTQAYI